MKNQLTAVILAATLSTSAMAGNLRIGTGSDTGTYGQLGHDIASYCEEAMSESSLEILPSGGSVANLDGMTTKKFSAGIVQEDVLKLYSKFISPKKVNEKRMKIITPLHIEPINLLIPKGYEPKGKKKGFFSSFFGNDPMPAVDINLLKNQQVAAWGGSLVSAQALSRYLGLDMTVVEVAEGASGNIPVIVVAGFPSSVVQNYLDSGKYQLVSINYDKVKTKADFYLEHKLSYTVGGKVVNVDTIGTRALLIAKASRKASRNLAQQELSTCIADSVLDLADDPDTNSNWEEIAEFVEDEDEATDWSYFKLLND